MPHPEWLKIAQELHTAHVRADGQDGHTAPDEWRKCEHPDCLMFRVASGDFSALDKFFEMRRPDVKNDDDTK